MSINNPFSFLEKNPRYVRAFITAGISIAIGIVATGVLILALSINKSYNPITYFLLGVIAITAITAASCIVYMLIYTVWYYARCLYGIIFNNDSG